MDTLHSLRARSDSFDSVGSFAVLSAGDPQERRRHSTANRDAAESSDSGEYDDDEWEVLSDDSRDGVAAASPLMRSVVIHDRHFDATASVAARPAAAAETQPACEHGPPSASCTTSALAPEPCSVEHYKAANSTSAEPLLASAAIAPLSPSSKSRHAREALKAFYLARARQIEARRKLIVVHPPLPSLAPPPPPVPRVILPLKAPDRYSVAVRDEVLRTANARNATAALHQFHQARELAKKQRAALNRSNEALLLQSQSGRGAQIRPSHRAA